MSQIAIYARKSTESEDRQVLSIDSQIRELQDFAAREQLGRAVIFTEFKSAKAPGRPAFNELVTRIGKREFDRILCWKLDRLARNPVDGGAVIWAVEEEKLRHIYTPQRRFDNSGNDKFWMQLEFGMAKKYVDDLSDNVKRGLRAKIEQGWRPGKPPLGYLNDLATKQVVKDPERFPLVRKMWDLLLTGNYTPNAIVDIATDQWGLTTRKFKRQGGGSMHYSTIYSIFTNPFYYGRFLWNNELMDGAHEPMITLDEFERAQYLMERRTQPRPKEKFFAYTGLITCGECGAAVTAEHKVNRYGHKYVYYHCTKRKRGVRCSQRVIEEKELESQIQAFLESLSIPRDFRDWALQAIDSLGEEEARADAAKTQSMKNRLASISSELDSLIDMKLRDLLSDDEFTQKRDSLSRQKIELQDALECDSENIDDLAAAVFDFAYEAGRVFRQSTREKKREILRQVGSNLTLKDKILRIQAHEPFERIKNVDSSPTSKSTRFEPVFFRSYKHKNPLQKVSFCANLGLVKDVRTFCRKLRHKLDFRPLSHKKKSKRSRRT